MPWLTAAKWIGTGAGVSGAIMIALNLGLVITASVPSANCSAASCCVCIREIEYCRLDD